MLAAHCGHAQFWSKDLFFPDNCGFKCHSLWTVTVRVDLMLKFVFVWHCDVIIRIKVLPSMVYTNHWSESVWSCHSGLCSSAVPAKEWDTKWTHTPAWTAYQGLFPVEALAWFVVVYWQSQSFFHVKQSTAKYKKGWRIVGQYTHINQLSCEHNIVCVYVC